MALPEEHSGILADTLRIKEELRRIFTENSVPPPAPAGIADEDEDNE